MNRFRIYAIGMLVVLTAGCQWSDKVKIQTTVYADGSFDRHIAFDPSGSRETAIQHYILPSGLSWEIKESPPNEADYVYEATGHFEGLETDYAKQDDKTPPQHSTNHIAVTAVENVCAYRETFRDTVVKDKLLTAHERYLRQYVEALTRHLGTTVLASERPDAIRQISQGVTVSMLAWQDRQWRLHESIEDEETAEAAEAWLSSFLEFLVDQLDRWWRETGAWYPESGAKERLGEAVGAWVVTDDAKQLDQLFEEAVKPYEGAYRNRETVFEVTVEMPATITDSNAHEVEKRRATWTFSSRFFWLKDYTLYAASPCITEAPTQP